MVILYTIIQDEFYFLKKYVVLLFCNNIPTCLEFVIHYHKPSLCLAPMFQVDVLSNNHISFKCIALLSKSLLICWRSMLQAVYIVCTNKHNLT